MLPASLAYASNTNDDATTTTNPAPFLLAPILNLPPSFGSAYVGETFSCTLCANHEIAGPAGLAGAVPAPAPTAVPDAPSPYAAAPSEGGKLVRDVRIEAEMKTPSIPGGVALDLSPPAAPEGAGRGAGGAGTGVDLDPGQTLQRVVSFDLKDEGTHVLGVTVSYYEATATSGRARTFRKLYQFVCKPSLIVRTKAGPLAAAAATTVPVETKNEEEDGGREEQEESTPTPPPQQQQLEKKRRWVLEAQLENCSEDTMRLERVGLDLEAGLTCRGCNWDEMVGAAGDGSGSSSSIAAGPVLHPAEVEQVCFVIEERGGGTATVEDGRVVFGVLSIGWRGEMGSRGHLTTGRLGTRYVK